MLNKKRAQIASTMTWLIATIAILVIIILFLIASGVIDLKKIGKYVGKQEFVALRFPEQQQTLFAIAENPEIKQLIINEEYDEAENKIKPILDKILGEITKEDFYGGWNLLILKDNKNKKKIETFDPIGRHDYQNFHLILKDNPDIKLRLWLECPLEIYEYFCFDYLK